MSDPSEWEIPGRPDDWPRIEPVDPGAGRERAHWFYDQGMKAMGDAIMAEITAVENGDEEAWREALDAQVRAIRGS
jgi:hypothetical protein